MQQEITNHIINTLRFPGSKNALQAELDKLRMQACEQAKQVRPQFVRHNHVMTATPENTYYFPEEPLDYDFLIMRAMTDGNPRRIRLYLDYDRNGFITLGNEGASLSIDAIAGKTASATGATGYKDFPVPIWLRPDRQLLLKILGIDADDEDSIVNTVFSGLRVFDASASEAQLTERDRSDIEYVFSIYKTPQVRYEALNIIFGSAGDGKAKVKTQRIDEPQFILGFRSTFSNATVNFGFGENSFFSESPLPIWAIAAQPGNTHQHITYLPKPIFVSSGQQLTFEFVNTIDGLVDAENGQFEIIKRTP